MILKVTLTHLETGEQRSISVEGRSRKAINRAARLALHCPFPDWGPASYENAHGGHIQATRPKKPQPSIQELAERRVCPECGGPVERRNARGPFPTFCSPECKKERGNRRLVRGAAAIEFLQAWRATRSQGETAKRSFEQLCRIADQFNAEDHAAGRPRADLCAAKILVDGSQYFDRQKTRRVKPAADPVQEEAPVPQPDPMADILRQIAEGHNDPRALAAAALAARS